ncbi:MAG: lipid-A-disaccharide synthase [bacterium]|nr:lipid-A-disaccharide synthase [bacterium]
MIVAGETSGDLHGSNLVRNMKKIDPGLKFIGMGGHRMKDAGVENLFNIDDLDIVGVSEVFRGIFKIKKRFNELCKIMDKDSPKLVILIDYPGFNLRLAKQAKKRNIKVAYYISPQMWAWGKGRIKTVKAYVDKMIVILPFEEDFYKGYDVPAEFVGHPLLDIVKTSGTREEILTSLDITGKPVVGLLPGSRKQEIRRILPALVQAAKMIRNSLSDVEFVLLCAENIEENDIERVLHNLNISIKIIKNRTYDGMSCCDLLIGASGTVTLEAALLNVPMIVVYKASPFTSFLFKTFLRVPHIGLVNIMAGERIVPELLQEEANPENISRCTLDILNSNGKMSDIKNRLSGITEQLGSPGASKRAAESIYRMLEG